MSTASGLYDSADDWDASERLIAHAKLLAINTTTEVFKGVTYHTYHYNDRSSLTVREDGGYMSYEEPA